jgi:hypothetical protein
LLSNKQLPILDGLGFNPHMKLARFPLIDVASFGKDQAPNTSTPGIFHYPWHRAANQETDFFISLHAMFSTVFGCVL